MALLVAENNRPLLENDNIGKGSLASATINLAMAVIGAGQLTLPFAMSRVGLALGIALLISLTCLGAFTLMALHRCASATGVRSYSNAVHHFIGPRAEQAMHIVIGLYAFGTMVSYCLIIKRQLPLILHAILGVNCGEWLLLVVMVLVVVWPLSLLRRLDMLKWTSSFGVLCGIGITLIVIVSAPWGPRGIHTCEEGGGVSLGPASVLDAFQALPMLSFSLNSSWAFLNIVDSLRYPTRRQVLSLIICAYSIVLLNYISISAVGYLSFCGATKDNILISLGSTGANGNLVWVANFALTLQLSLGLPMRVHVLRGIVSSVFRHDSDTSSMHHFLVTTCILWSAVGLGLTELQLHDAIGLTAAMCASIIIYVMPGTLEIKRLQIDGFRMGPAFVACLSVSFGVVLFLLGTAANIDTMVHGD